MACRYIYKGFQFDSELKLDDFLLEKLPFEPILGDMVFSQTQSQNLVESQMHKIYRQSKDVRKQANLIRKQNREYDENGDPIIKKPPFIGVNRFVREYRTANGNQIVREFRDKKYWEERFADWEHGLYTDDEKVLFGITSDVGPMVTTTSQKENMRDQIKEKWRNQAKAGDAVHNVLQLFFTKVNNHYLFELSDDEFKQYCLNNIDEDNIDYITSDIISKTIEYARELHQSIKTQFGEECIFHPEFTITSETNTIDGDTLLGMIDLIVIDKNGNIHIIDYKTSLHSYEEYNSDKILGYNYQQAIYQRMLEKLGLNMNDGKLVIAPIQILGFKHEGDKWTYDDITFDKRQPLKILNTADSSWDPIWANIDQFLVAPLNISVTTNEALSTVADMMNKWFPDFSDNRLTNEEAVVNWLKKHDKLKKNEEGNYVLERYYDNKKSPIISDNETEFVKKVTEYFKQETPKRVRKANQLQSIIKSALKNGINSVEFPTPLYKTEDLTWIKDTIKPYCNGNWEIEEAASSVLEQFGIIMLKTKDNRNIPPQIDLIRVSTRDLYLNYRQFSSKENPYRKNKSLIGAHESDLDVASKQGDMMLSAAVGNVELMETLLVLNQIEGLNKHTIGNIQVVNPNFGNGLLASNEELAYCWREFNRYVSVKNDKFASGEIKFASKYDLVEQKVAHALATASDKNVDFSGDYKIFSNVKPLQTIADEMVIGPDKTEAKIKILQKCLEQLVGKSGQQTMQQKILETMSMDRSQSYLKRVDVDLYNSIQLAIGELKGNQYRQQLEDHDQWFSDVMKMGTEGFYGNYSDNPGNLKSETLNMITKQVTQAYQNTRDEITKKNVKVRQLVQKLKDELRMNAFLENTVGNQVNLYKNMIKETEDGDLVFVNPNTLQGAEREFLTFALDMINKDRFNKSQPALDAMRDSGDINYYRVPLCVGGFDSMASEEGLLSMFKAKLEYFLPSKAWEMAKKKAEGIFDDDKEVKQRRAKKELLFKMTNIFDMGNNEEIRIDKIKEFKSKKMPIEKNLEILLLKHMFAYSVQRNMDEVFPLIKSAMIHIQLQGAQQSTSFKNDLKFITEYIENKIFNKTIVEPENERWVKYASQIKHAASLMTLAVAPVQVFYQTLQGFWNDIKLIITKPDQKESFTFNNFRTAVQLVFSDLFHFSDKPTLCSALNELYGINDMDINQFVERISSAKKGIWNLENFLFKFASRPDFYNRMSIFISQMLADGSLKAYHLTEDGQLVYDWTKDDRFSKFAEAVKNGNGNSSDPEIAKQRSLYYAVAKQFVNEHARNADGTLFELNMNNPVALPRAYTNQQAESMKSLGDTIYGYYSHEKKSLIMSTAVGSLWLQFRTYWSGKKNQYLAPGGVKLQGDWVHIQKNREYQYYQVDEQGNILYDQPILSESEMKQRNIPLVAPVIQWKGQWQEGIILTLCDLVKNMWHTKSVKEGWRMKFGKDVDPYLRKVYESNLKSIGYDIMMWGLVGSISGAVLGNWLDKLKKDNIKNKDFLKGIYISAANVAVMSVENSFLDFNFIHSIGSPFGQWTPFSIEWGGRMFKNWWNVLMGDEDFWDGVVKSSGGLKQIKPALDTLKPDFWKTEREGGTFNIKK